MPLLHGVQENLIVSLIESRSGSTEDKTENLISLQFAFRKIAKLNSIPNRKMLFKQNRFSFVTRQRESEREGYARGAEYETRFAAFRPGGKVFVIAFAEV